MPNVRVLPWLTKDEPVVIVTTDWRAENAALKQRVEVLEAELAAVRKALKD